MKEVNFFSTGAKGIKLSNDDDRSQEIRGNLRH